MTIRLRNRITFIFVIISLVFFLLSVTAICIKCFKNNFIFPEVYLKGNSSSFWLMFNPNCVVVSIILLLAYVVITSYIIYRSFEKSQATDMLFFLIFLAACLLDTVRVAIISVSQVYGSYSKLILKMGTITLFARLLAPLALMGSTVLSQENFRQNADQNCMLIIISALFFSEIIPLNSAIILPDFSISYGYSKTIHYYGVITFLICICGLYLTNKKNENKQLMTLGFAILYLGYVIMFQSYNLLTTITGPIFLSIGTTIYVTEVHKQYLWLD